MIRVALTTSLQAGYVQHGEQEQDMYGNVEEGRSGKLPTQQIGLEFQINGKRGFGARFLNLNRKDVMRD